MAYGKLVLDQGQDRRKNEADPQIAEPQKAEKKKKQ
jgi:hypothetical protein